MSNPTVVSPCIGNCCLDDEDICLGCFRRLQDILNWQGASDEQRLEIIEQCHQRKRKAEEEKHGKLSY